MKPSECAEYSAIVLGIMEKELGSLDIGDKLTVLKSAAGTLEAVMAVAFQTQVMKETFAKISK